MGVRANSTAQTVLAIDQGTSGTKAVVLDADDGVVGVAEVAIHPRYLAAGGVEQDPAELLDSVLEAGRRAVAVAGRPVQSVSLANQGETVLAWDRTTGRSLSPAVVWQDRRSEALVHELAGAGDWVAERTGLVLDPYFSAPKMAWLRENVTRDGVVTCTDSWIVHHLCGEFVTDASTVSRSLLTSLDSVEWDPELLALFTLETEQLPRIVGCDEVIGSTTAFGTDMPVAGLVVDQQAALFAEGCLEPGMAKCTFGTGAFLLAHTGDAGVRSSSGLTGSVAWRLRGETAYCLDGQVYTAASAVRWLTELGLIAEPADLDRLAADDAGAAVCVPALAGLAAPWWRPDATASFLGMTLATTAGQLILAVLQGIAAQVAELADSVGADFGAPLNRLRVDGGLVQCRTLMQATADLLQIPVDVYPSPHATALGAAAFGRLAIDSSLSVRAALPQWSAAESYQPAWSIDRAADFRSRWRAAAIANLPTGAS
jgi:glycerol kinase